MPDPAVAMTDNMRRGILDMLHAGTGADDAKLELDIAQRRAEQKAATLLAASQCPPDLIEWGRMHNIPEFAAFTWMAGFAAGMRVANLKDGDRPPMGPYWHPGDES